MSPLLLSSFSQGARPTAPKATRIELRNTDDDLTADHAKRQLRCVEQYFRSLFRFSHPRSSPLRQLGLCTFAGSPNVVMHPTRRASIWSLDELLSYPTACIPGSISYGLARRKASSLPRLFKARFLQPTFVAPSSPLLQLSFLPSHCTHLPLPLL
jgi:hypothetical protein